MRSLFAELKRRNVVKVVVAYIVVGWVVLQVAETIAPIMSLPDNLSKYILFFLIVGFPITIFFSWVYELTPEGLKKQKDIDRDLSITVDTGRKIDFIIIGALVLAIGGLVYNGNFRAPPPDSFEYSIKTIAVLPFVSMGTSVDDGYFADGLTEELLNSLAQLSGLKVTGRTSSFYYKGKDIDLRKIGAELSVAHILEGSIRRSGDKLRITAQLIETQGGSHLWSKTYDRTIEDIFAIQDEIAKEVTNSLRIALLGEEEKVLAQHGTNNPEAQSLYFIASARLNEALSRINLVQSEPATLDNARKLFEEVTRIDPKFQEAWVGLINCYIMLSFSNVVDEKGILLRLAEGLRLSREALAKMELIDPNSTQTLFARAVVHGAVYQREVRDANQLSAAINAYERALDSDPNNVRILFWYAGFYYFISDYDKAINFFERELKLDPLSISRLRLSFALIKKGRFSEAKSNLNRINEVYPDADIYTPMAEIELIQGHFHHALLWLHKGAPKSVAIPFIKASLGDLDGASLFWNNYTNIGGSIEEYVDNFKFIFDKNYSGLIDKKSSADYIINSQQGSAIYGFLAQSSFRLRRYDEALKYWQNIKEISEFLETGEAKFSSPISGPIETAYALEKTGNKPLADIIRIKLRQNIEEKLERGIKGQDLRRNELNFLLFASEGKVEEAIIELETLVDKGWGWLMGSGHHTNLNLTSIGGWFEDNPVLDSIRDEPRFIAALDKIKASNAVMLKELKDGLTLDDIRDESSLQNP